MGLLLLQFNFYWWTNAKISTRVDKWHALVCGTLFVQWLGFLQHNDHTIFLTVSPFWTSSFPSRNQWANLMSQQCNNKFPFNFSKADQLRYNFAKMCNYFMIKKYTFLPYLPHLRGGGGSHKSSKRPSPLSLKILIILMMLFWGKLWWKFQKWQN